MFIQIIFPPYYIKLNVCISRRQYTYLSSIHSDDVTICCCFNNEKTGFSTGVLKNKHWSYFTYIYAASGTIIMKLFLSMLRSKPGITVADLLMKVMLHVFRSYGYKLI